LVILAKVEWYDLLVILAEVVLDREGSHLAMALINEDTK
jgi:hypothetical protein